MKIKILGVLVSMLLIAAAIPAVGITNIEPEKLQGVLDQSQERDDECKWFQDAWQEFVPVGKKLLHVEVKIKQGYADSPDLWLYIEKPLGTSLASLSKKATEIPDTADWVEFDIEDIELTPGKTYVIHLKFDPGGEYAWCGANGDVYPSGDSDLGAQWDWCFKTYVDKSKKDEKIVSDKETQDDEPEESPKSAVKTLIWGRILFPRIRPNKIVFRAVNVHYWIIGKNQHGVYKHQRMTFSNEFKGRIAGMYVCAVFDGEPL